MITNVVFKKLTTEREPNKVFEIDINKIIPNPCQPRKIIREEELIGLSQSIRKYGLIQPIAVRRIDRDRFELISGERRLRACRMIGLEKIPATVIDVLRTDSAVLAIIENIQRKAI